MTTATQTDSQDTRTPKDIVVREEQSPFSQHATIFRAYFWDRGTLYPMYTGAESIDALEDSLYTFHKVGSIEYDLYDNS